MITKREFMSLTSVGGLASVIFPGMPRAAWAQQATHAATRMLVGFGAGGVIDVIARMLVDGMKDHSLHLSSTTVPGAGGRVALGVLKVGPADGTTMILTPASNLVVFPHVYKSAWL